MPNPARPRRWVWIAAAAVLFAVASVAILIATGTFGRMARDRVVRLLKRHYGADLQFRTLNVRLFPEVRIEAEDLTWRQPHQPYEPPLITISKLPAATSLLEALLTTPRIREVRLEGLQIQVSRRQKAGPRQRQGGKQTPDFVIDSVVADETMLTVVPKNEEELPLEFDIERLRLAGAGRDQPMSFRATLKNAEPPGDIKTTGQFGPWQKDDPGATPVNGRYTFRNADLSVFRGIAGTLASDGSYSGALDRIEVDG